MADDRIVFTTPDARRIGRVVRIVEAGNRDTPGIGLGVRLQDLPPKQIRLCTWTASWEVNALQQVRFSVATQVTASARNVFLGVAPGSGVVARDGKEWNLICVNLATQPGYSSGDVQLFGHTSDSPAIATWYSITSCATATASP